MATQTATNQFPRLHHPLCKPRRAVSQLQDPPVGWGREIERNLSLGKSQLPAGEHQPQGLLPQGLSGDKKEARGRGCLGPVPPAEPQLFVSSKPSGSDSGARGMGVSGLSCKPGNPQAFCQSLSHHLENGHSKLTSAPERVSQLGGGLGHNLCLLSSNLLTDEPFSEQRFPLPVNLVTANTVLPTYKPGNSKHRSPSL